MENFKQTDLEALVVEALKHGGKYCDLFFEDSWFGELVLRDSVVAAGGFNSDCGCGIRVLNGEKTGYAYSESMDFESLKQAAKAASSIGNSAGYCAFRPPLMHNVQPKANLYGIGDDWRRADIANMVPFLEKMDRDIRARDARAVKVIASLSYQVSDIMMYNSLGELARDIRPLGSVSVTVVFQSGDKTETQNASGSFRMGMEMLKPEFFDSLVDQVTKDIDARFAAGKPKGGKMSVVMGAGASGILLHEAMGHAFEADFNRKGQSIFSERMGQRICPEGITIVDDGTLPGNRGAVAFDDEGIRGQRTVMVENGILRSYLHDRISANYYKVAPTGNGRRESFRYEPIPRMRATYMENGRDGSVDDLIASVRKGIYVDRFSNGQVKIGEGDFTFFVQSGYLIENGRLTMPVKDINIIGNGPKALADIRAVASDLKIDNGSWTCGKGQSVPVSCGMPSILIENLTVGGAQ